MLSMVPGLGQFYNGEARKGFLFLDVAILNYILLSIILLAPVIATALKSVGMQFGVKVNGGVLEALRQMQFGSPLSFVVSGMILAFIAYAVRDAYDHAKARRRRAIYKDAVIELPEATSGSYIFHASIVAALAVMAVFFFIPKPPKAQITEITFVNSVTPNIQHPKQTTIRSQNPLQEQIHKFNPQKPVQKSQPKSELSKSTQENQTSSKPATSSSHSASAAAAAASASAAMAKTLPPAVKPITVAAVLPKLAAIMPTRPVAPPAPPAPTSPLKPVAPLTPPAPTSPAKSLVARPLAPSAPQAQSMATPAMAKAVAPLPSTTTLAPSTIPLARNTSSLPAAAVSPAPSSALYQESPRPVSGGGALHRSAMQAMPVGGISVGSGLKNAVQLPTVGSAVNFGGSGQTFSPQVGRSGSSGSQSSTGAPGPIAIATRPSGSTGSDAGPVPEALGKGTHGSKSGPAGSGSDEGTAPVRPGHSGSGGANSPIRIVPQIGPSGSGTEPVNFQGAPGKQSSVGAAKDPDFSLFMSRLQSLIKKAWFPPHDAQTKTVRVMFKVHTNGELSNLRISHSSGISVADQAALSAVENAAPFGHLPEFSPENVDIEFTFDYNVLHGR